MTSTIHPRLASYVEAWRDTAERLAALAGELSPEDWDRATDCPGWSVRDVYAHLAALETELAGGPAPTVEVPDGGRVSSEVGPLWTQAGIDERAGRSPEELVDELAAATRRRLAAIAEEAPQDPSARPPATPGGLPWDWEKLLRYRVIDLWMHEQDVRRAVDRPGGWDAPAAAVTLRSFAAALPYVLGKKVAPPSGTTVVWVVEGLFSVGVEMGADGRAVVRPDEPAEPDLRLTMSAEAFVLLAGGRREPTTVPVQVEGDEELAKRVLAAMAVTP